MTKASVAALVAEFAGVQLDRATPETRLLHDLGIDGDDAADLLQEYQRRFKVDLIGFDFGAFFNDEGAWPWEPLTALWRLARSGRPGVTRQPLTVARLEAAAARGRWAGE